MAIFKVGPVQWAPSLDKVDGVKRQNINKINSISYLDTDASSFITAAGITDATQKTAINNLTINLKGYGLWAKMDAIYPFVGGTSTTHKFNLKNPADTDGAFRLVFYGGVTHDSNGVTFNGTTGYADTFWIQSSQISSTDYSSTSLYSRTNSITSTIRTDMAVQHFNYNGTTGGLWLSAGYNSTTQVAIYQCDLPSSYTYAYYGAQGTNTNTTGFYSGRQDSTTTAIYKNGSIITSNTFAYSSARSYANTSVFIGADRYNGSARRYSNKNLAFAHIGTSMTDGDMSNLYTIVQAYQTTLGRQV
jgi:hypothetical protein